MLKILISIFFSYTLFVLKRGVCKFCSLRGGGYVIFHRRVQVFPPLPPYVNNEHSHITVLHEKCWLFSTVFFLNRKFLLLEGGWLLHFAYHIKSGTLVGWYWLSNYLVTHEKMLALFHSIFPYGEIPSSRGWMVIKSYMVFNAGWIPVSKKKGRRDIKKCNLTLAHLEISF